MITILIEVRGGVVQEIYSDQNNARVVLVDWDRVETGDSIATRLPLAALTALPSDTRAVAVSHLE